MAGTDVICILPWTICKVLYFLWKNVALEIKSQIIEREYSLLRSHTGVCTTVTYRQRFWYGNLMLLVSLFTGLF